MSYTLNHQHVSNLRPEPDQQKFNSVRLRSIKSIVNCIMIIIIFYHLIPEEEELAPDDHIRVGIVEFMNRGRNINNRKLTKCYFVVGCSNLNKTNYI